MRVTCTKNMGDWRTQNRCIKHKSGRFFTLWPSYSGGGAVLEQPEIGCLGLLVVRDKAENELKLLLQKKKEPGTIGDYEYSTTVQATRSNLDGVHGGSSVRYAEYFDNPRNLFHCSLQIEQTDAYVEKCNANIIKVFDCSEVEVVSGYELFSIYDLYNLLENDGSKVSMDLRSVGSIFLGLLKLDSKDFQPSFHDQRSLDIFLSRSAITDLNQVEFVNAKSYKQLVTSSVTPLVVSDYSFEFFDVEIEGREVSNWTQPMLTKSNSVFYCLDMFSSSMDLYFFPAVVTTLSDRWKILHASESRSSSKMGIRYHKFFEEGGRFYQVENFYGINKITHNKGDNMIDLRSILNDYLLPGMATSIELRSLLFVVLIHEYCDHV